MTIDRAPIDTEQELKLIRDGEELSMLIVLKEMLIECMSNWLRSIVAP